MTVCFHNKAGILFSWSAISPMELEVHSNNPKQGQQKKVHPRKPYFCLEHQIFFFFDAKERSPGWTSALAATLAVMMATLTARSRTGHTISDVNQKLLEATTYEHSRRNLGLQSRSVKKKNSSTSKDRDSLIPVITWKADLRGGSSSSFFNSSSSSSSLSVSNK